MGQRQKYADDNERKRAYKQRNRENICVAQNAKYNAMKATLSPADLETRRTENKKAAKEYRRRQKEKVLENSQWYSTPQSLGKAVKKVRRSLPRCPLKKIEVLRHLVKITAPQILAVSAPGPSRTPWNVLSPATHDLVKDSFTSADIVWTSPLARDNVRIPGTHERMSRCYLTCSLNEAYHVFQQKHPDIKLGFSTFCDLKPVNVKLSGQIPQMICLCKYHENFRSLVVVLSLQTGVNKTHDFLNLVVCNTQSALCMMQECENCSAKWTHFEESIHENIKETVAAPHHQWVLTEGRMQKEPVVDATYQDVLDTTHDLLDDFKSHCFVKRHQQAAFDTARKNSDEENLVIQVDYSENYSCMMQDEIAAMHFQGGHPVSLFTCCVWHGPNSSKSIALVSDCTEHSKYSVMVCLQKILQEVKSLAPEAKRIDFFRLVACDWQ